MNLKVLIFLLSILSLGHCFNILMLVPVPGPSHWLMFKLFIKELINRGHHVTAITGLQYKEKLDNYTEIYIDPPIDMNVHWSIEELFSKEKISDFANVETYFMLGTVISRYSLGNKVVQDFIKRKDLQFDLIISEQWFQECFLALKYQFKAPVITISTFGHTDAMDRAVGLLTPWSHVPHHLKLHLGDDLSFCERLFNVVLSGYDALKRHFVYMQENQRMIDDFIQPVVDSKIPSVFELEKEISLILINNHLALSPPRPMMPNQVNIAGAHIKPLAPLPIDLQKILDDAHHGVIYFSLGSYLQSSKMPRDKIKSIIATFAKLKQTILWKYEEDNLSDLPKNVIIRKWLPQSDILAHKNMKVFISHGGLFGTIEGIHNGLPMLFIPFFSDQFRNAKQCINKGFGKQILFADITTDALYDSLSDLLNDKSFSENGKKASLIFKDNINDPMEVSMFWIEHVARHKGADHLKSAATHLNWLQYLLIDILGILFLIFAVAILIVRKMLGICFKKKAKVNVDTRKKRN